jgi:integrase
MSKERFQLGEFWLGQRRDSPVWYICWLEPQGRRYRTRRHSTGERDFERAKERLAEHFISHVKLREERPEDVPLFLVLDRYYQNHGCKLPSKDSIRSAIANWKLFWGTGAMVGDLTLQRQKEFETWLRERTYERGKGENRKVLPLSPGTVARQWNVGVTALEWAREGQLIKYYPAIPYLSDDTRRKRTLTLEEAAALFNAVDDGPDNEHLWRWLLLEFGFATRPNAPLELQPGAPMLYLDNGYVDFLPPGRKQNPKKRRPTLPIPATLLPWLRQWTTEESLVYVMRKRKVDSIVRLDRLITFRGRRIRSIRQGFDLLKKRAGITDPKVVPYTIRHTMTTWFMRQRVPEWDREVWLGHKEPGNATTAGYVHLDPQYLAPAAAAVDAYFALLAPLLKRPIGLRASCAPVAELRPA